MALDSRPPDAPSPTLTVLRIALLVAWALIGVSALAGGRVQGAGLFTLCGAALAVFVAAMWASLDGAPHDRHTARVLTLLAVQVVSGILVATDFMFLVAIQLPLVLRPRRAATAFAVLVALVLAVGFAEARFGTFYAAPELASLSWPLQVWLTMAMTAGWLLLAFAGGLLAATEARARHEIGRLMSELRLTSRALEETSREAERLHIARELHDTVGHRLAALGVALDLESRRTEGTAATAFREARDATHEMLGEVRQVVGALRQERPVDLKRAIAQLIGGLGPLEVEFRLAPGFELRDPARAHALLRCAQEALTNVVRHSGARRVRIDLRRDEQGVALDVQDDGRGAEGFAEGFGLRGMRERLAPLGGTLTVTPGPGRGFALAVRLPAGADA